MLQSPETAWRKLKRVWILDQPVGLGATLAVPGFFLLRWMILAITPEDHWFITFCTILMALASFYMLALGIYYLSTPFQRVWISPELIQLRLGKLTLRSIPVPQVRTVTSEVRKVLIRNRECDIYRVKFYCNGSWPHNRTLWMDWSVEVEEALKETLTETSFLF